MTNDVSYCGEKEASKVSVKTLVSNFFILRTYISCWIIQKVRFSDSYFVISRVQYWYCTGSTGTLVTNVFIVISSTNNVESIELHNNSTYCTVLSSRVCNRWSKLNRIFPSNKNILSSMKHQMVQNGYLFVYYGTYVYSLSYLSTSTV